MITPAYELKQRRLLAMSTRLEAIDHLIRGANDRGECETRIDLDSFGGEISQSQKLLIVNALKENGYRTLLKGSSILIVSWD